MGAAAALKRVSPRLKLYVFQEEAAYISAQKTVAASSGGGDAKNAPARTTGFRESLLRYAETGRACRCRCVPA